MTTPGTGSAETTGRIDIDHEEAEEIGSPLIYAGEVLKHMMEGGYGSPYGLEHWKELLGDVFVTDDDLRGVTGGLQAAIQIVIDDIKTTASKADACGKGLLEMSKKIKNTETK